MSVKNSKKAISPLPEYPLLKKNRTLTPSSFSRNTPFYDVNVANTITLNTEPEFLNESEKINKDYIFFKDEEKYFTYNISVLKDEIKNNDKLYIYFPSQSTEIGSSSTLRSVENISSSPPEDYFTDKTYILIRLDKSYLIDVKTINEIIEVSNFVKFFELTPMLNKSNEPLKIKIKLKYSTYGNPDPYEHEIYDVRPLYDQTGSLISTIIDSSSLQQSSSLPTLHSIESVKKTTRKNRLKNLPKRITKSLSIKRDKKSIQSKKYNSLPNIKINTENKLLRFLKKPEYYSKLINTENIPHLLKNKNLNKEIFDWCKENHPIFKYPHITTFDSNNPLDYKNENDLIVDFLLEKKDLPLQALLNGISDPSNLPREYLNYTTGFFGESFRGKAFSMGTKLKFKKFSANPNSKVVEYLLSEPSEINWDKFSANPNPNAVEYLLQNVNKINWYKLSSNPNPKAVDYLLRHKREINWDKLSSNPNPKAVDYLLRHEREINWDELSSNPNPKAVDYLLRNERKINWDKFNANPNTKAVEYVIKNASENPINSYMFSKNPNMVALNYLKKNKELINWEGLAENPTIFTPYLFN